ncbi:sigma-54-dependent Fis family transcriptional regulator [Nitratireductor aquimarinus]|uniref:helix-turn-helix domain-containing protein n=1 Tax=Nitratireductor TaxID=245876 RepID=UPI000DDE9F62|nr:MULTISPECIES: GAF domain-containing protein [Nitratireductor]MBN7775794.1 sigma-54-dependent Fis family transcriptional regulator [Nitratireductor pacificus]MBN7780457.1 sigma-54-dependent Fis family transcriptional regulator [Nitratireductor pacificus]MBN7789264.1 sigma-54-dependent Fis family transcriptional regulator [Nitratireductor aquimarinus]MBN8242516.1 sigma-54-dependent Fis family transcriptional regulator [Nitratireductor aquimarinus]MBY6098541.1 GAF domain-containing protein [Ni
MDGRSLSYHADRVLAAVDSNRSAKSALVASWQRSCRLHRLDPAERRNPERISDAELAAARARLEPLLRSAQTPLDQLFLAVGSSGCCVVLADRQGILMERRGTPGDDETFRQWGLWTGTVWSEQSEGTNGIGTCLVERRTLTIHRDQHFHSRNTLLSCTTAPVYDHEGHLAGALDVSSCRADLTDGFVSLIATAASDAARRIEAEAFRLAYPQARIMLLPAADPSALIAVDSDDLVIGATRTARALLDLPPGPLANPLPACDVLGGPQTASPGLAGAERSALQRALVSAGGNVSEAARQLGISRATMHRKMARLGVGRTH